MRGTRATEAGPAPPAGSRAPVAAGMVLVALAPLAPWHVVGATAVDGLGPGAWRSGLGAGDTAGVAVSALLVALATGCVVVGARRVAAGVAALVGGAALAGLGVVGWTVTRGVTDGDLEPGVAWSPGPPILALGGVLVIGGGVGLLRGRAVDRPPSPVTGPAAAAVGAAIAGLLALSGPWWVEPGLVVDDSGTDAAPMLRGTETMAGWMGLALVAATTVGVVALGLRRPAVAAALAGATGGAIAVLALAARVFGATHGTGSPYVAAVVGIGGTVLALVALGRADPVPRRLPGAVLVVPFALAPFSMVLLHLPGPGPSGDGAEGVRVLAGPDGESILRPGLAAADVGEAVRIVGLDPVAEGDHGDVLVDGGGSAAVLVATVEVIAALDDHRVRPLVTTSAVSVAEIVGRSGDLTVIGIERGTRIAAWPDGASDFRDGGGRLILRTDDRAEHVLTVDRDGALWAARTEGRAVELVRWTVEEVATAFARGTELGTGTEVATWDGPLPRRITVGPDGTVTVVEEDHRVRVVTDGEPVTVAGRGGASCPLAADPLRLGVAAVISAVADGAGGTWLLVDTDDDRTGAGFPGDLAPDTPTRAVIHVADGVATRLDPVAVGPVDLDTAVSLLPTGVVELLVSDAEGRVVGVGAPGTLTVALPDPPAGCRAAP